MAAIRLRRAREDAGLTQSQLADRAGVSRQLVSSAEAGRHLPAVDAALRLARALGEPVESLFAADPGTRAARPVTAGPLRDGDLVVVGRVGSALCAAPLTSLIDGDASWGVPDGVVIGSGVRLLPGAAAGALIVVGCDPVLGLCESLLAAPRGERRMVAVAGSSAAAVAAVADGRAHAALVHGPPGGLPEPPVAVTRIHLARWRVGVGLGAGSGRPSLAAVLAGRVPLVQREDGAASQQALLRAAGDRPPPAAGRASGHVEAARVASRTGCAAVTFEPAARRQGIAFLPLETHVVEVWIDDRRLDHPAVDALIGLLRGPAFRDRVRLIGGYDLDACGDTVPAGPPTSTPSPR